ncbi:hypothetical protein KC19_11G134100 [Ceratodon purpureus]|uniref:Uncharacterized protein n=1 Tax=Ceratodon purpureus TaxID=3225 RepID=A0A8T0GE05_CERPU|nr:hypothetical protein KC19_11G134100 [Ceratodon purpureus]
MVAASVLAVRRWHGPAFIHELERWLRIEQHQGDCMVAEVKKCLDEKHLLLLPLPKGVHWPVAPLSRNFRFLFRRQVAHLLGWKERRVEGDSSSFSSAVNLGLRQVWWPDEDATELHGTPGQPGLSRKNFGEGFGEAATPQQGPISVRQTVRVGFGAGGGERREVRQRLDLGAHTTAILEQTVDFAEPPSSRPSKTTRTNAMRSRGRKRLRPVETGKFTASD